MENQGELMRSVLALRELTGAERSEEVWRLIGLPWRPNFSAGHLMEVLGGERSDEGWEIFVIEETIVYGIIFTPEAEELFLDLPTEHDTMAGKLQKQNLTEFLTLFLTQPTQYRIPHRLWTMLDSRRGRVFNHLKS